VATFEPSFDDEISYLLKHYSAEQLKTFYVLRRVTEARRLQDSTPSDDRTKNWLSDYLPAHGLTNSPNTLAELTDSCKRLFPELADWHKVSESWFDPTESGHYTNELANDSGMFRDQYIFPPVGRARQPWRPRLCRDRCFPRCSSGARADHGVRPSSNKSKRPALADRSENSTFVFCVMLFLALRFQSFTHPSQNSAKFPLPPP